MKRDGDARRHARPHDLKEGDRVLFDQVAGGAKVRRKSNNIFFEVPYIIKRVQHSMITAVSENGHCLRRKSRFFKRMASDAAQPLCIRERARLPDPASGKGRPSAATLVATAPNPPATIAVNDPASAPAIQAPPVAAQTVGTPPAPGPPRRSERAATSTSRLNIGRGNANSYT
jgi:hypothetical protein